MTDTRSGEERAMDAAWGTLRAPQEYSVWIAHEDGAFRQHRLDLIHYRNRPEGEGDQTLCGIKWDDLPLNVYQPGNLTYEGDKPWYNDHERDDVVICLECYGWK